MNTQIRRTGDRLHSILYYCQNLPAPLTASAMGANFTPQLQALTDAINRLTTYSAAVTSGTPSGSVATRRALRNTLRVDHLDPIRRVARALAHTHPDIEKLVRIPAYAAGMDVQLSAARAIANDIAPYRDLFVADGLPADFLDQLNAAIQTLAVSVDDRRAQQQQQAANREGITAAIRDGRQAARHLDPLVRSALKASTDTTNAPAALAAWMRAYRVPAPSKPAPAGGQTPPAQGASVTGTASPAASTVAGSTTVATAAVDTVAAGKAETH